MNKPIERVLIAYGSESGNARALAEYLGGATFLQPFAPQVTELNQLLQAEPNEGDLLLLLTSSFGDGEPPANADRLLEQLPHYAAPGSLRYAIFGLGDTAYPQFCGFSKALDAALAAQGGQALINRVDADAGYQDFFRQWLAVVEKVLQGDAEAGQALRLQVTPYGEQNAFTARVLERSHLSGSAPHAWHIRLDIRGSGIRYRAGDTLWVLPENDPTLLAGLAAGLGDEQAITQLRDKELRQLSKGVLRELAKLGGSEALKALLKSSQRKALEAYLWGADLLDVLQDHCPPGSVSLAQLLEILSPCLPRAYSIASAGDEQTLDLCVREVSYARDGRPRQGMATGWLLAQDAVKIFVRSNPACWLPEDADAPLLLVGTGTGIAPLIGLTREMTASGQQRETCLIFGDKQREVDFLYRQELEAHLADGVLSSLLTAFSRDGDSKYYVQHAIADHADQIAGLLQRGAHLYLCGNRHHLESAVRAALDAVAREAGWPEGELWPQLLGQGRLHLELY